MLLNCGVGEESWESLARRSKQSILKEIRPGCSLEGLMLKLKLQYFGHLMGRADSLEKTPMLGGIGGRRRRGRQRMRWHHRLNGHEFEWTLGVGDGQGGLECCDSWVCKESDTTERLNWTELKIWHMLEINYFFQNSLIFLKYPEEENQCLRYMRIFVPNVFILLYYLHFKALTSTVRWSFKMFIIHDILLSYIHYNLLESFNNAWLQKAIPHNRYRYLNITPSIFYYFMKHSDNWTSNFVKNEGLLSSFKIIQNINVDSIK